MDQLVFPIRGSFAGDDAFHQLNIRAIETWARQILEEAVFHALADAKGDLLVGSAADLLARLAVGADDTVLTADSGETLGMKWATPRAYLLTSVAATTSFSNSTAENTLFSFTIPGGTLEVGDLVRLTAWGRLFNNTGAGVTNVWRIRFGSSTPHQGPALNYASHANQRAWRATWEMVVEGASAQRSFATMLGTATGQDGGGWAGFGSGETLLGFGSGSVAIASDQTLTLTQQMGTASANASVEIRGASLERFKLAA